MKKEEDMESTKKGSPPGCRGARGKPRVTALRQAWEADSPGRGERVDGSRRVSRGEREEGGNER